MKLPIELYNVALLGALLHCEDYGCPELVRLVSVDAMRFVELRYDEGAGLNRQALLEDLVAHLAKTPVHIRYLQH